MRASTALALAVVAALFFVKVAVSVSYEMGVHDGRRALSQAEGGAE